jgi:2-polyprenyl-6-methoxyphenol hydroxylase-like FAD-dependent oxidoreductase
MVDRMLAIVRFAALRSGTFTAQTVVEAAPDGWWYCARLPHELIVTVLVTERRAARALTHGGYAGWRELLADTSLLAPRLDACELDDERFRSYPVASAMLDRVEGDGWIAVGDAAAAYDPIASQGIHKALADAADASRTIAAAGGRAQPPPWRYGERVAARFEDYLANRAHLYALERRWTDRPFWRRRSRHHLR